MPRIGVEEQRSAAINATALGECSGGRRRYASCIGSGASRRCRERRHGVAVDADQ
jgi:hypothetical protein